ncbi:MAG: inositol-3-phosphate synthase, partial [Pseudomonadota bacterium]
MKQPENIRPPEGKIGVLIPGMGAVATTFVAGCLLAKKGAARPIGSLVEYGHIRLGKRTDGRQPLIRDFVGLASIDDLVFGGWDLRDMNLFDVACEADVLDQTKHLEPIREELENINPMPGVFFPEYVKRLEGTYIKEGKNKMDLAEQLRADIQRFVETNKVDRCVSVWCGSTETYLDMEDVHSTLEKFEAGLEASHPAISPSMVYGYALLKEGVPFANGAPNVTLEIPALLELAAENKVPVAGKDFKTGQTLMKTLIAPGMKARMLGIQGWFSTNILG